MKRRSTYFRDLQSEAARLGMTIERGTKHLKVIHPEFGCIGVAPFDCSENGRAAKNLRATMRRAARGVRP